MTSLDIMTKYTKQLIFLLEQAIFAGMDFLFLDRSLVLYDAV